MNNSNSTEYKLNRKKTNKLTILLLGKKELFTVEHQYLNGLCLLISLIMLFGVFLDSVVIKFSLVQNYFLASESVILLVIYLISRKLKKYVLSVTLFLISLYFTLSSLWFFNSGSSGTTIYFYYGTLAFLVFLLHGKWKIVYLILLIFNVSFLFILEIKFPKLIVFYENDYQKYSDLYAGFIVTILLVYVGVEVTKKLYKREKQNTIDIIEQYRISSEKLKNEYHNQIEVLSLREREVFKLIIEGKTNQEIAEKLFIEVGTVKIHINKIYKKLGTKNRRGTINFVAKHK